MSVHIIFQDAQYIIPGHKTQNHKHTLSNEFIIRNKYKVFLDYIGSSSARVQSQADKVENKKLPRVT
jgi:hypothetical protein